MASEYDDSESDRDSIIGDDEMLRQLEETEAEIGRVRREKDILEQRDENPERWAELSRRMRQLMKLMAEQASVIREQEGSKGFSVPSNYRYITDLETGEKYEIDQPLSRILTAGLLRRY